MYVCVCVCARTRVCVYGRQGTQVPEVWIYCARSFAPHSTFMFRRTSGESLVTVSKFTKYLNFQKNGASHAASLPVRPKIYFWTHGQITIITYIFPKKFMLPTGCIHPFFLFSSNPGQHQNSCHVTASRGRKAWAGIGIIYSAFIHGLRTKKKKRKAIDCTMIVRYISLEGVPIRE